MLGAGNDLTIGCQTSDSASSSKFHHFALLVALVSHNSNVHHWPLLDVALVSHLQILPSYSKIIDYDWSMRGRHQFIENLNICNGL